MMDDDYEVSINCYITSKTGGYGHLQLARIVPLGHLDVEKFAALHRLIESFCDSARQLITEEKMPYDSKFQ